MPVQFEELIIRVESTQSLTWEQPRKAYIWRALMLHHIAIQWL